MAFRIAGSVVLAVGVAGFGLTAPGTANAQDFYEGRTLEILVGLSAGGTNDTLVREIASYWERYIPGNPTIVVQNMPGGGGMRATNYLYEVAEPDGETIYFSPWLPVAQAMGDEALRARYEDFEIIGGARDTRIVYMRTDVPPGLNEAADIMNLQGFRIGGYGASDMMDVMTRLGLDILGVEYDYVPGYGGGSDIYAAMLRNEVHMHNTSVSSYYSRSGDMLESGEAMGVYYVNSLNERGEYATVPELADEMPSYIELYQQVHGTLPSGPEWEALNWLVSMVNDVTFVVLAPPGTPPEAVEALRASFYQAVDNEDFKASFLRRVGLPFDPVDIEEVEAIFDRLARVDPAVVEILLSYVESGQE